MRPSISILVLLALGLTFLGDWLGEVKERQEMEFTVHEGVDEACDYCDSDEYLKINIRLRYGEGRYRTIWICQEDLRRALDSTLKSDTTLYQGGVYMFPDWDALRKLLTDISPDAVEVQ